MRDFFISYATEDKQWAEWIAWQLEEAGYSLHIQAWDFRPGGNYANEVQRATIESKHIIAVLSNSYLDTATSLPEWADAFARDPSGSERILIPVRIETCSPNGILATRIPVDFVGLSEAEAKTHLLQALEPRAKPSVPPTFPGGSSSRNIKHAYPGNESRTTQVWKEKLDFLTLQKASNPDEESLRVIFIEDVMRKLQILQNTSELVLPLQGMQGTTNPILPRSMTHKTVASSRGRHWIPSVQSGNTQQNFFTQSSMLRN